MSESIFTSLRRAVFGLNESEKIQLMILTAIRDNPGKNLVIVEGGLLMLTDSELEEYNKNENTNS